MVLCIGNETLRSLLLDIHESASILGLHNGAFERDGTFLQKRTCSLHVLIDLMTSLLLPTVFKILASFLYVKEH